MVLSSLILFLLLGQQQQDFFCYAFRPTTPFVRSALFGSSSSSKAMPGPVTTSNGKAKPLNNNKALQALPFHADVDDPPPGWVGGFMLTNPRFLYPPIHNPNLGSIDYVENKDLTADFFAKKITRWQKVKYPEFSWCVSNGIEESRIFTTFEYDVSRIGYDNRGQVWRIVCPQKQWKFRYVGDVTLEATVDRQRGWVNEPEKLQYSELGVTGQLWIELHATTFWMRLLRRYLNKHHLPFSKKTAMVVPSHVQNNPKEPNFPLISGNDPTIKQPKFKQHYEDTYDVAHLRTIIGKLEPTGYADVDAFEEFLLSTFNLVSGGILREDNLLAWQIWYDSPSIADPEETTHHLEKWGKSEHRTKLLGNPLDDFPCYYFNGKVFKPRFGFIRETYFFLRLLAKLFVINPILKLFPWHK